MRNQMRNAFVIFPHAADEFELQAMGVRFDTPVKKTEYGLTAFCAIDQDTADLIAEHSDRFVVEFKSDTLPGLWDSFRKARTDANVLRKLVECSVW